MPPADKIDDQTLVRAVVYGPPRSKKTWWALMAARLGFNVHLFDADGGWEIIHATDLTPEEKARINIIDITDAGEPVACYFLATLFRQRKMLWDEKAKSMQMIERNVDRSHGHYMFNVDKLSTNDVVIVDSWTAIVASLYMRYFQETGVDLYDVDEEDRKNKRAEFGWAGALANHFLNHLSKLPCHVVLIGHETVWEKRVQKQQGNKQVEVIEDVRTQLVSTSGPNARDIIRRFGNALHFVLKLNGDVQINVRAKPNEDAGSRLIPPGLYSWDELSFSKLADKCQKPDGTQQSEAVKYLPAGSEFTFEDIGLATKSSLASKPISGANGSAQVAQVAVDKPVVKPSPFAKLKTAQATDK